MDTSKVARRDGKARRAFNVTERVTRAKYPRVVKKQGNRLRSIPSIRA